MKIRIKTITRYTLLCFVLFSCEGGEPTISYSERTVKQINRIKQPVVLFSKSWSMVGYGVYLMDGDGVLHYFGNMSSFANSIGDNYKVGDTLK